MPKLPLDPDRLRHLPGLAITALRHPRSTARQAVSGTITIVGGLVARRPAEEPVPGATTTKPEPPPTDVAAEPVGPATEAPPATPEAPPATPEAPETPPATPEAPETPPATSDSSDPDDEVADQLSGPAPHIPPSIAHEVERDFGEDLPGVSGERER